MARADEFAWVSAVLSELAPDADIRRIDVKGDNAPKRVITIGTRTPGRLIGRRGATADAVRTALADRFSDDELQLNILETPEDPPPDRQDPDGRGDVDPPR